MAIETIQDVVDATERYRTSYLRILQSFQVTLPTRQNLSGLAEGLSALIAEMEGTAADLQTVDEDSLISVLDGPRQVSIWRWRRLVSFQLAQQLAQVRGVLEGVTELLDGLLIRVVTVKEGDTLQRIARRELGSWRAWPDILAANPAITDPFNLPVGLQLVIPGGR